MSEQWEYIIERELDFLYHAPEYESELKERLYENEINIIYPRMMYGIEEGSAYKEYAGAEAQAIKRIEKREALKAGIKRINQRVSRMIHALNQLDESEYELIVWAYLEQETQPSKQFMAKTLGYRSVKEFENAKKKILCKLLSIYDSERKMILEERRKELIRNWRESSNNILKSYGGEVDGKQTVGN